MRPGFGPRRLTGARASGVRHKGRRLLAVGVLESVTETQLGRPELPGRKATERTSSAVMRQPPPGSQPVLLSDGLVFAAQARWPCKLPAKRRLGCFRWSTSVGAHVGQRWFAMPPAALNF